MGSSTTMNPLAISPPDVFITPPTPLSPPPPPPYLPNFSLPLPRALTSNNRTTSLIIHLPPHAPLATALTPTQLIQLFPTLHIYILPSHPSIALLPTDCIAYRGLSTTLRWKEAGLANSGVALDAELDELVSIYQALAFLGNRRNSPLMRTLDSHIRQAMNDGVSLDEIVAVWALRRYAFTEPLIHLLLTNLAMFSRAALERFEQFGRNLELQRKYAEDVEFRLQLQAEHAILRWIAADEEVSGRVCQIDEKITREEERKAKEKERCRMYGYKKGRKWIARSAVKCFESVLESVDEEPAGQDRF